MKYRVGLDLTVGELNQAGTGIYATNLFHALQSLSDGNEYCDLRDEKYPGSLRIWRSFRRHFLWPQIALPSLIRKSHIDVLHMPANIAPIRVPCPTVVTILDAIPFLSPQNFPFFFRNYFRIFSPIAARTADRVLTISENSKRDISQYFNIPASKIVVTPLAHSPDFRPSSPQEKARVLNQYNLDEFILTVGTLEPRKNIPLLLKAVSLLQERGFSCVLVHAGSSGWLNEEVDRCMNEFQLTDRVRFLGFIPREDLIALYSSASVFIYPSLYEGFGLPVLEAMACGCPVVASRSSSIPEIVNDAAILVDPHDSAGFADAIVRVCRNRSYASELSERGLQRSGQFSWKKCAEQTRDVYHQVLQSHNT